MGLYFSPIVTQFMTVILANITMFTLGLGMAWTSPMLPQLRDEDNPVLGVPITDKETSWIVSIAHISTLVATAMSMYTVDRVGRKNCIVISGLFRILCYIIMLSATNAWMIILARVLSGFADGFAFVATPPYASEIASKDYRGRLGTFTQIFTNFGRLITLAVGPYLDYTAMNLLILINCVLATALLVFIPDSLYSLFSRGKQSECKNLLLKMRETHEMAIDEIEDFVKLMNTDNKVSLKEILKAKTVRKTLTIIFFLGLICEWTGYLALLDYLQTILVKSGSDIKPELSSMIVGIIQFMSTLISPFIHDRFDRKPIMFVSFTVVAAGMMGLATYYWRYDMGYNISGVMNVIQLISIIMVFIGYNSGFIFPILIPELFDGPARGIGVGLIILASSTAAFTVTWFMYPLIATIGTSWTFFLYACVSLLLCLYIKLVIPETKGKTFKEIQIALGKKVEGNINNTDIEHSGINKYIF